MRSTAPRRPVRMVVAAAAVLAVAVTGCGGGGGQAAPAAETRVFTADNGDITIPARPQRVVATGYAVPVLIESGAPLVGISSWKRGIPMMTPENRSTYESMEKIAGEQATETNYEAIAKADPDVIVIGVPKPVLADIDLERLGSIAPVVALGPQIPSDWREVSRKQADAAGVVAGFDQLRADYQAKADALKAKFAPAVGSLKFGHVGAYGQVSAGTFQREFNGSWGTNVANDIGVQYYGQVRKPGNGSAAVSETPSVEEIPASLGEADVITYSVGPDGAVAPAVEQVLNSPLWQNLPAVQAGRVFPFRYTEAATYPAAMQTLDAIDQTLAPLLAPPA